MVRAPKNGRNAAHLSLHATWQNPVRFVVSWTSPSYHNWRLLWVDNLIHSLPPSLSPSRPLPFSCDSHHQASLIAQAVIIIKAGFPLRHKHSARELLLLLADDAIHDSHSALAHVMYSSSPAPTVRMASLFRLPACPHDNFPSARSRRGENQRLASGVAMLCMLPTSRWRLHCSTTATPPQYCPLFAFLRCLLHRAGQGSSSSGPTSPLRLLPALTSNDLPLSLLPHLVHHGRNFRASGGGGPTLNLRTLRVSPSVLSTNS